MRLYMIILTAFLFIQPLGAHESKTSLTILPKTAEVPLTKKELVKGKRYLSLDCDVPAGIRDEIRDKYKMTPVWWGLNDHDNTYLVHRNPKTNNWVMFAAFKSGAICVMGTGPTSATMVGKYDPAH